MTTTHKVKATRDGKYWIVDIEGVGITQAQKMSEVEMMARDYIAAVEEVAEDSFNVDVEFPVPDDVRRLLDAAEQAREAAKKAADEANENTHQAAVALRDRGMTVREIGPFLGVSFQRAQQLVSVRADLKGRTSKRRSKVDA